MSKRGPKPPDSFASSSDSPESPPKLPPGAPAFAAKCGLPPLASNRLKFSAFIDYWRSIPDAKRVGVTVYMFRMFPAIVLPPNEHAIATIPGEQPLGGEDGDAEAAILASKGLGDYFLILKYTAEYNKEVCRTLLRGYSENLPGFRDFKNNPPLIEGELSKVVNLIDSRNISSGYLSYLQGINAIPGESQKVNEESMADQTAGAVAMGVLGKIAEKTLDRMDQQQAQAAAPAAPPATPANTHEWDAINKTIETVNEVHKQTAVNVPELLRTAFEITRPAPAPPPPDTSHLTDRIDRLTDKILNSKEDENKSLREEMRELRSTINSVLTQAVSQSRAQADAPAAAPAPLDPMAEMGRRLIEKRMERMFSDDGDEDDSPRRRRYEPEPQPAPEPGKAWWESAIENGPFILSALGALVNGVATAAHNINVARTGEGQTTAPAPMPPPPGMPNVPGFNPMTAQIPQGQQQGGQGQEMFGIKTPQQKAVEFLNTIEAGLVGAMERGETGYEYAETYVKTIGRLGEFGYQTLHDAHNQLALNPQRLPFPQGSVTALAYVLQLHQGIWNKIHTSPNLEVFLTQFVSYDEMLKEFGARNVQEVCFINQCQTLQEVLDLPEDDGTVDDNNNSAAVQVLDAKPDPVPVTAATPVPAPAPARAAKGPKPS